jgi:dienelactone hydrolase
MQQDDDLFAVDAREPLALWQRRQAPPAAAPDLRAFGFEYTSRGDRVPGRLLLPPEGPGPFPLVLLQHGLGGSKQSPYLDATAPVWVRGGAAVASIDFPLHGARASGKLSEPLLAPGAGPDARTLATELMRQAVIDLRRAVDAAAGLPEVDAARVAYAGFSLGAIVGATFCGVDPRPRAAALALGGGGLAPAETDPLRHVARIAPRPLLLVGASRDRTIPRAATEALFDAARDPKQLLWFDAAHDALPGQALKAMWHFLRAALAIRAPG